MTYRFLPWVRKGLAAQIDTVDDLTPTVPDRARIPARVTLLAGDASFTPLWAGQVANEVTLHGPGDIIGLDPRTVLRVEPPRSTGNANPDQFAAVELDTPDLPWIFTPLGADGQDRLRPWLVLVVVAVQDGVALDVDKGRLLPVLRIEAPAVPADELPDLAESWAWAHSQIVGAVDGDALGDHLAENPHQNLSRLLCPRRLEPGRRYLACLVPAFEAGRLAGLGEPVPAGGTTEPAWHEPGPSIRLPVYHHWSFATGPAGDFESLARRLTPRAVPGPVGTEPLFIGAADPGLPTVPADGGGTVPAESALRAPLGDGAAALPLPPELDGYLADLVDVLNAPAGHTVGGAGADARPLSPPIYGGPPARVERLDGAEPVWLGRLNRDPRYRAIAGLGADVVRQNQERFMDAAWAQVGDIVKANQRLEQARLLQRVAERTRRRHIARLPDHALLALTGPVHDRISDGQRSLQAAVARSFLPDAMVRSTYRRLASPRSPILRRAARKAAAGAEARSVPVFVPGGAVQRAAAGSLRLLARPILANQAQPDPPPQPVEPGFGPAPEVLELEQLAPVVLAATDPVPVAEARIGSAIRIAGRPLDQVDDPGVRPRRPLDPIMVGPDLSTPMIRELLAYAPDRLLAGSVAIPDDTVTLLEPNPRFVEAFLIGANHEMNRELLWRRYPTDRRGTPFRRFWDRADASIDLAPLHTVPGGADLGSLAGPGTTGALTLLIRGQLLRRFPGTVIYAVPATADRTVSTDPAAAVNPIFWGHLDPDLVYVGFDLTRDQVAAGDGWFFVLAEQPTDARFGLDAPNGGEAPPATWSDLTWGHLGVEPGGHLHLAASGWGGAVLPLAPGAPAATFGRDSAQLAAITMQRPFRVALHAQDLLAGVDQSPADQVAPVLTHARLLHPIAT